MSQIDGQIYHLIEWKNQYCQNDYTAWGNLQINAIPIKSPIAFLIKLDQKH